MRRRWSLLAACVLASPASLARAVEPSSSPSPAASSPSPAASSSLAPASSGDPSRPAPRPPVDDLPEPPRTEGDEFTEPAYFDLPFLTVALHPILLVNPLVVASVEVKIRPKWSAGILLGGGSVRAKEPRTGESTRMGYLGGAAQVRYYVIQSFGSGFFVALDAEYNHVDSDQLISVGLDNSAAGLGVGPLGGFKLALPQGPTVDLSIGAKKLLARPTPSVPTDESVGNQPASVLLALRLGLGWTF